MTSSSPLRLISGDRSRFLDAVARRLREHVDLIDAWQGYSMDKRTGRGPYFGREPGSPDVGFYDSGYHDVRVHHDRVEACSDFVYREAAWVVLCDRVP